MHKKKELPMFETSVVQAQAVAVKSRVSLFTVSLALHSAVLAGAVAVSIATVEFPTSAPDQFAMFQQVMPVAVPPPLGNPNGGAKPEPKPEPKPAAAPPQQTAQVTAPPTIPNDVPQLDPNAGAVTASADFGTGTGTEPGPVGVPWGVKDGLGSLDTPPGLPTTTEQPVEPAVYRVTGEVKGPRVLRRVEPVYPEIMRRAGLAATVRIRCIVDRNGAVRQSEIVTSSYPPFNDAVLAALRQWRFAPGSLHGTAVDTEFELTVQFKTR
jgi:protein TonB